MITSKQILILFFLSAIFIKCNGQNYKILSKRIILLNKQSKIYAFENDTNSIYINFLGVIKTKKNKRFKIITIKNVWGINKHTNAYIWIYNYKNEYMGRYVLGDSKDLPIKLKGNNLIFSNQEKGCSKLFFSKVNFYFGIKYKMQLPTCGGMGDIYQFEK